MGAIMKFFLVKFMSFRKSEKKNRNYLLKKEKGKTKTIKFTGVLFFPFSLCMNVCVSVENRENLNILPINKRKKP